MMQEKSSAGLHVISKVETGSEKEIRDAVRSHTSTLDSLKTQISRAAAEDFKSNGCTYDNRKKVAKIHVKEVEDALMSAVDILTPIFVLYALNEKKFITSPSNQISCAIRDSFEPYFRDYFGKGSGFGLDGPENRVASYLSRDRSAVFAQTFYAREEAVMKSFVDQGLVSVEKLDLSRVGWGPASIFDVSTTYRLTEKGRRIAEKLFNPDAIYRKDISNLISLLQRGLERNETTYLESNELRVLVYLGKNKDRTIHYVVTDLNLGHEIVVKLHEKMLVDFVPSTTLGSLSLVSLTPKGIEMLRARRDLLRRELDEINDIIRSRPTQ